MSAKDDLNNHAECPSPTAKSSEERGVLIGGSFDDGSVGGDNSELEHVWYAGRGQLMVAPRRSVAAHGRQRGREGAPEVLVVDMSIS